MQGFYVDYKSEDGGKEIADLLRVRNVVGPEIERAKREWSDSKSNMGWVIKLLDMEGKRSEKHDDGKKYFKTYDTIFHIVDSTVKICLKYEVSKPNLPLDHKKQEIYAASTYIEIIGATEKKSKRIKINI